MKKFEEFDYEKTKEKWFEVMTPLTDEEISGLFGLIEAQKGRLEAIKDIINE